MLVVVIVSCIHIVMFLAPGITRVVALDDNWPQQLRMRARPMCGVPGVTSRFVKQVLRQLWLCWLLVNASCLSEFLPAFFFVLKPLREQRWLGGRREAPAYERWAFSC